MKNKVAFSGQYDMIYQNYRYINEFGQPIERTPDKYNYSYDDYVTYRGGNNKEANHTMYSDRMLHDLKYNDLCQKWFGSQGQMFDSRKPEDIENWLRDWYDDQDLKLILIMQYCNQSNGYPLWRFDFKHSKK